MNLFSGIGAVVAVVGIGLAAAGAVFAGPDLVIVGLSLLIPGAIFFFTGRRIGGFKMLQPRLLQTGVPARGLVKRMWETGVTVNDQPVLGFEVEVVTDRREPYAAQVQQAVPRMLVGAVLPGSVLAIETDPADDTHIAIDWSITPEAPGFAPSGDTADAAEPAPDALPPEARRRSIDDLLATGRHARGVITSMRRMGRIGDLGLAPPGDERWDDELFLIELDIEMAGLEQVVARVLHRVPDHLVGRVGPGLKVDVRVDRANPEREVAIVWDGVDRRLT